MVTHPAPFLIDSLVDLACRDGVDIRPTLLRVITDLYVQKPSHSSEDTEQYVELALGLIDAVDAPTRAAVAARLRDYPAAPSAIMLRLFPKEQRAERPAVPPSVSESDELIELFFTASPEERRLILLNIDVSAAPENQAIAARADAVGRLETAALKRNRAEFIRTLGQALGITDPMAERVTGDTTGEPLVVAAKALAMPVPALQRILLFLDPAIGHSIERVYSLSQLFQEMPPRAAHAMVAIWQNASARARPPHAPVHQDAIERQGRRFPANAARPRTIYERDAQTARAKGAER